MPSDVTPNEKLGETLFAVYAYSSCLNAQEHRFYAPSTREELEKGYDQQYFSKTTCHELVLQFKRGYQRTRHGKAIAFSTTQSNQLQRLHIYSGDDGTPFGRSAYFIAPVFWNLDELREYQDQYSRWREPIRFLEHYIAVDASVLEDDNRQILIQLKGATPIGVFTKTITRRNRRKLRHRRDWLTGRELLEQFLREDVGHRIGYRDSDQRIIVGSLDIFVSLERLVEKLVSSVQTQRGSRNLGVYLRMCKE